MSLCFPYLALFLSHRLAVLSLNRIVVARLPDSPSAFPWPLAFRTLVLDRLVLDKD